MPSCESTSPLSLVLRPSCERCEHVEIAPSIGLSSGWSAEWNSTQPTPSPRSISEALQLRKTSPPWPSLSARTIGARDPWHGLGDRRGVEVHGASTYRGRRKLSTAGQQSLDQVGYRLALVFHPPHRFLDADRVPDLERSHAPSQSPTSSPVDRTTSSAISPTAIGGVGQRADRQLPGELPAGPGCRPGREALPRSVKRRPTPIPSMRGLVLGRYSRLSEVESEDLLALLLVETPAALLARATCARAARADRGVWKMSRCLVVGHCSKAVMATRPGCRGRRCPRCGRSPTWAGP